MPSFPLSCSYCLPLRYLSSNLSILSDTYSPLKIGSSSTFGVLSHSVLILTSLSKKELLLPLLETLYEAVETVEVYAEVCCFACTSPGFVPTNIFKTYSMNLSSFSSSLWLFPCVSRLLISISAITLSYNRPTFSFLNFIYLVAGSSSPLNCADFTCPEIIFSRLYSRCRTYSPSLTAGFEPCYFSDEPALERDWDLSESKWFGCCWVPSEDENEEDVMFYQ